MSILERLDERFEAAPKQLREPAVAFAAASIVGPLIIVLLAVMAGQTDTSSPLYTLAAAVFVGAVCGFMLTTYRAARVQRAQTEQREAARAERLELMRAQRRTSRRSPAGR